MKILQSQLKQAEFVRTSYAATPEHGVSVDDVLVPEFWAHVAKQFKVGDRIEVKPDGADWLAEFYVLKVDVHGVHLVLLNKYELVASNKAPAVANDDEYEINFGGAAKWRVIRKSDREVMVKGLGSKAECETWLAEQKAA
jgi:hypothetical protein